MNKKFLSLLVFLSLFVAIVVPMVVFAQADTSSLNGCNITNDLGLAQCPNGSVGAPTTCNYNDTTRSCGLCCLLNAVYTVVFWVFVGLMAISALMIILGAFTFVTSGGNPDKTTQARNYIIFAAIGIAVALFSRAVPSLVKLIVGAQ
jgi:hypothetical protein